MNDPNENRKGYKNSQVGWIPVEWESATLGKITHKFRAGVSVNSDDAPVTHDQIGVLKTSCVSTGRFRAIESKTVVVSDLQRVATPVRKNSVIMSRMNTVALVGANAFVDTSYPNLFLPDRLWEIRVKNETSPFWFGYMIGSPWTRLRVSALATGTSGSMKNVTQEDVRSIAIPLPPLPEQRKIAAILSAWDRTIAALDELLAAKQRRKLALMQQLLSGQTRLPGCKGKWVTKKLGEIANIEKGKALSSKDLLPGSYPVIAGGQSSPYSHSSYTHQNVVTVSASGAYAGYVSYHTRKIWASDCSVIMGTAKSAIEFLFYNLTFLQNRIYLLQSGGAQPHVYPKDLAHIDMALPESIDEQRSISAVLSAADRELSALSAKRDALKLQKKGLMQQLLTGRKRVKV